MHKIAESLKQLNILQMGVLLLLIPLAVVFWLEQETSWLPLIGVPIVLVGYYYRDRLADAWKTVYIIAVLMIVIVIGGRMVRTARLNVMSPPEFDFQSFWLNGRIGVQGLNIYDPENYRREAAPLNPSPDMVSELLDTAFWYPAPSILLFLPLGWFSDVRVAMLVWYIVTVVALALCMWLIWKLFFAEGGRLGLLVAAAVLFLHHMVWATVFYGQSTIILLLVLLLFWRDRDKPISGVWAAVALLIKPLMGILLVYLLFQKQWRAIAYMIVTGLVTSLVVILQFGSDVFFSYNPTVRLPPIMYVEWVNQGILAFILRVTNYDFGSHSPIGHPLFIISALVVTATTLWIVFRLPKKDNRWALSLLILLALLVYPATLMHYSLILLPVLLYIWADEPLIFRDVRLRIAFITLEYAIIAFDLGAVSLLAFALCWIAVVAIAFMKPNNSSQLMPLHTSDEAAASA